MRKRASIGGDSNPSEARQSHTLTDPELWNVEESYVTPEQVKALEARLESALQVSDGKWRFRRFEMTPTTLIIPDDVTVDEMADFGKMLSGMNSASQFWTGDWANRYIHDGMSQREIYEAYDWLSGHFNLEHDTLRDYAWVCRTVPASLRKDTLKFSHHKEAAKAPDMALELLSLAESEGWTVRQLRDEISRRRKRLPVNSDAIALFSKRRIPNINKRFMTRWAKARQGNAESREQVQRELDAIRQWVDEVEESLDV